MLKGKLNIWPNTLSNEEGALMFFKNFAVFICHDRSPLFFPHCMRSIHGVEFFVKVLYRCFRSSFKWFRLNFVLVNGTTYTWWFQISHCRAAALMNLLPNVCGPVCLICGSTGAQIHYRAMACGYVNYEFDA